MIRFLINKFNKPMCVKNTLYLLSNECNNNCIFCFFDNNKFLSYHRIDIRNIVNKIKFDTIYLSGGEPFYSDVIVNEFKTIISLIDYVVPKLVIFTNGYSLDILRQLNINDKFSEIHIIVNSNKKIYFDNIGDSNTTYWNKIYLNDIKSINNLFKYKDNTDKINVVFSLYMDSIWKKNTHFKPRDILIEYMGEISNLKFKNTRLIDINPIYNRLNGFYSEYDFYDFGFYHPFIKTYSYDIKQLSCSKCDADFEEKCLEYIKNDRCIRIKKMCVECEYKDICFAPTSKFDVMNYDEEFCNKNLKILYKWYIENFLETETNLSRMS